METVITDTTKMKSHLSRVDFVNYNWCFYKNRKRDKETQGRIPGKDWKYPVANERMPRTAGSHQKLRTGKEDFFPQSSQRHHETTNILISDF